jgi:dipeptidyl aminopeptidase/acylaminoacyl peptidase
VKSQVVLDELDLSPDGRLAVVARRTVLGLEYRRQLLLVPLDGGAPRQLTQGAPGGTHPRFSPDGRALAFLSERLDPKLDDADARGAPASPDEEPRSQVWVLPLDGGEAWPLTHEAQGVSGFAWSPDGQRLAYWGWQGKPRFLVGERDDGRAPTARHIRSGNWRWDEIGHLDYRTHLAVVAVRPGARPTVLTGGDFDVLAPAWEADGRHLVFCADLGPQRDLFPRPRVYRVPADGTAAKDEHAPREVAALGGLVDGVTPSPDGLWLALLGSDVPGAPDWAPPTLYLTAADGTGGPVPLAPGLDRFYGSWVDTDLHGWSVTPRLGPFWLDGPSGRALVGVVTTQGRSHPWLFPVDAERGRAGGEPRPLLEGDSTVVALATAAGRIAVLGTQDGWAPELLEVRGGAYRRVTRLGSAWQGRREQPVMEDRWIEGPGGPIEVWLASPPGVAASALPLVVDIHGGPLGGWAPAPALEVQLLCSAGFRVALPNIRGSTGYGAAWIKPHMGHWGEVDAEDVLAVVDALVADGLADRARIGLLGLSYGGFLVNWLVGAHPKRWAAAVSENGVTDQLTAWAGSDSGPDYARRAHLGEPLNAAGVARLWRQSPLRLAPAIRAPLLMLQGEADLRCPAADNQALYVLLKALDQTAEFVLYPESGHVFAASGRPDRRVDRHRRMLDWFERYLGQT